MPYVFLIPMHPTGGHTCLALQRPFHGVGTPVYMSSRMRGRGNQNLPLCSGDLLLFESGLSAAASRDASLSSWP